MAAWCHAVDAGKEALMTYTVPAVFERHATVAKVVDGDTLHLGVDLGCDTRLAMTVRLYGVNTPELPTPEGVAARDFVSRWLADHQAAETPLVVRTVKDRREKYGRYLVDLLPVDGSPSLCQSLLDAGMAQPYQV